MIQHLIKNWKQITTTPLRRDALSILEAGLRAIDTRRAVMGAVKRRGNRLTIGSKSWNLSDYRHVFLIGIGKAAGEAACVLEAILGPRLDGGLVLDVKIARLRRLRCVVGTHPLPSPTNRRATSEIRRLLEGAEKDDLIITIISGGGSALLCQPYKLTCQQLSSLTLAMMRAGATIEEMNTVRKHLSEIQGGQFSALAYPATVVGLIFSDVPGDNLGVVASGPTVRDTTTVHDARKIIDRYHLLDVCLLPDCDLCETPKERRLFSTTTNTLIVTNQLALSAMQAEARKRGYSARIADRALCGEARDVGRRLASRPCRGQVILAGGETTVTVRGDGRGGRNQELALGALQDVPRGGLVLSCGSDGIDNTPVAGAFMDDDARESASRLGLDAEDFLRRNDAYTFFKRLGTQIETGKTGANVADLMISMRSE